MAVFEFPASFAQRGMWLIDQLDPGQPTYNVSWTLRLDGALDLAVLAAAWDRAVGRHEALQTSFRDQAGTPIQVIDDEFGPAGIRLVSLEHLPEPDRERAAGQLLRELASAPFDLSRPPLVRACLLRLSPARHALGVVAHHIVVDGWSVRLLFEEVAADYEAGLTGGPPVSAEPALQYADFAIWQVEHAEDGGYAAAERFWREELAGAASLLPLPTDHPYPSRQTFTAGAVDVPVEEGTSEALRRLAAQRGITLFSCLLAAYAAVLSRLTGSRDLLVGVPVAGRTRPETEPIVGLFMNTLPVRVRLAGDPTLGQVVDEVHRAAASALAHQEVPFARVVDLCRPERDPARGPLVQVTFALEEPWPPARRGGLEWRGELIDNGTVKVELALTMVDEPDGLGGRLQYNDDLFDEATARRFVDGFGLLLAALGANSEVRVADVDILDPVTRALITQRWAHGPPLTAVATATALIAAVCRGDQAIARGAGAGLTGAQLRRRAREVAGALSAVGVRPQDRVGLLLSRGPVLLPALVGIWWLGAAYVPLDPMYPRPRLRAMARDARVRAVVTDASLSELAQALAAEPEVRAPGDRPVAVLDIADAGRPAGPDPASDQPLAVPPTAAAYTIFTSGSTGRPKAVTITQGGLAALLQALRDTLPLGPEDRLVAVTTLAFDISVLELLLPALCGAQVIVADAEQAMDGSRLRRLLAGGATTALQATPATWRLLLAAGGVPASVRLRLCGGEALARDLADELLARADASLWNLYGPTETTVWSAAGPVGAAPEPVQVGPAIAGSQIYVLDHLMQPVAPGVIGEVYIGGAGVGHGYLGAAALTAGRFLPDPYGGRPGARLYRTGDLGRWRASGRIELVGRADRQVKVRGFRVETAEIEAVLRTHADVVDAVVTLHRGGDDARLVAYLVTGGKAPAAPAPAPAAAPAAESAAAPAGLREHVRTQLPDYMVPAAFVVLARLPRTPNGKVDYRALPEPRWADGQAKVAARTPLERELAAIVAELLALAEPVGVHDNFFALGGHSLTATRMMARVRASHGIDLPVRVLFADPTVAGLARAVAAASAATTGVGAPASRGAPLEPVPAAAGTADAAAPDAGLTEDEVEALLRTLTSDERR